MTRSAVWMMVAAAVALGAGTEARAEAPALVIAHAAARLVVIPEARTNISVTVQPGDPRLPRLAVQPQGAVMTVEGGLADRILSCDDALHLGLLLSGDQPSTRGRQVRIRGIGRVPYSRLPLVTARVPLDAQVSADGAVWSEIGPTSSLVVDTSGCGDTQLGDVRGRLLIRASGTADVRGGASGPLTVDLSGAGGVSLRQSRGGARVSVSGTGTAKLGAVDGPLHADVSGAGDIDAASLTGDLDARIGGSGDVRVHAGAAPWVQARIGGTGDLDFAGTAGALNAVVAGTGDVRVAHVTGAVTKSVAGTGDVVVGR